MTMIQWIEIKKERESEEVFSSHISKIGYDTDDPDNPILIVHFHTNGSIYHYFQVSEALWEGLRTAPSTGKYFWKYIRNSKPQIRVR